MSGIALGLAIGWYTDPSPLLEYYAAPQRAEVLQLCESVIFITLTDLGKLESTVGSIIVSAAVFDDVLSLLVLSVLTAVLETGGLPDAAGLLALSGRIALFFAVTIAIGRYAFPYIGRLLSHFQTAEYEFTALIVLTMMFSVLAELLGLHFIVGAFLAGLYFEKRTAGAPTYIDVERKIAAVTTGFLAPLFFASIGLSLDLSAVTAVPWFLTLLILCAIFAKLVGAGIPAYAVGLSKRDAVAVGVGMSGRGAVELIVAGIALRAGLFEQPDPAPPVVENLFSAIVIVAIVTTLAVPVLLRWAFHRPAKRA